MTINGEMEKSSLELSVAVVLGLANPVESQTNNGVVGLVERNKELVDQIVVCVAPKKSTTRFGLEYDFSTLIVGTAYSVRFVLKKPLIGIDPGNLNEFNLFIVPNTADQKFSGEFSGVFFTEGTSFELSGVPAKLVPLGLGEVVEIPHTVRLPVDGHPENEGSTAAGYEEALRAFIKHNCLYS